MSATRPKTLVLAGDGINCEAETAEAFRLAGFQAEVRHLNDLMTEAMTLDQLCTHYAVIALPGGFSFGDDLGSGRVLALKIQFALNWNLSTFVQRGGLVMGICNGFQALIRLGVFHKQVSITQNQGGKFINKWVKVTPNGKKCIWLRGMGSVDLPMRHGEGRVIFSPDNRNEVLGKLRRQDMLCLQYDDSNPNGSDERIAGLCDSSGRIFGLMPHPEAHVRWTSHPEWTLEASGAGAPGKGLMFFENAFKEAKDSR